MMSMGLKIQEHEDGSSPQLDKLNAVPITMLLCVREYG